MTPFGIHHEDQTPSPCGVDERVFARDHDSGKRDYPRLDRQLAHLRHAAVKESWRCGKGFWVFAPMTSAASRRPPNSLRDDQAQKVFIQAAQFDGRELCLAGSARNARGRVPTEESRPNTNAFAKSGFAFRQADGWLCPYSPDGVFRSYQLLAQFQRFETLIDRGKPACEAGSYNGQVSRPWSEPAQPPQALGRFSCKQVYTNPQFRCLVVEREIGPHATLVAKGYTKRRAAELILTAGAEAWPPGAKAEGSVAGDVRGVLQSSGATEQAGPLLRAELPQTAS